MHATTHAAPVNLCCQVRWLAEPLAASPAGVPRSGHPACQGGLRDAADALRPVHCPQPPLPRPAAMRDHISSSEAQQCCWPRVSPGTALALRAVGCCILRPCGATTAAAAQGITGCTGRSARTGSKWLPCDTALTLAAAWVITWQPRLACLSTAGRDRAGSRLSATHEVQPGRTWHTSTPSLRVL